MTEQEQSLVEQPQTDVVPVTEEPEQQLIQDMGTLPPEIQACMFLERAIPEFMAKAELVTGNQSRRVLCALVESPLEKTVPGFTTQEAMDLFMLGMHIQNAKHVLFTTALANVDQQKLVQEAEAAGAGQGEVEVDAVIQEIKE